MVQIENMRAPWSLLNGVVVDGSGVCIVCKWATTLHGIQWELEGFKLGFGV